MLHEHVYWEFKRNAIYWPLMTSVDFTMTSFIYHGILSDSIVETISLSHLNNIVRFFIIIIQYYTEHERVTQCWWDDWPYPLVWPLWCGVILGCYSYCSATAAAAAAFPSCAASISHMVAQGLVVFACSLQFSPQLPVWLSTVGFHWWAAGRANVSITSHHNSATLQTNTQTQGLKLSSP